MTRPLAVIKLGGGMVDGLVGFWPALLDLLLGCEVVLVHGGGPQATDLSRRLGHEPRIVHGRRVTGDVDLDIVTWTMRGAVNLSLSAQAYRHGIKAAGISGADGGVLRVSRRPPWNVDGEEVDFGWVGEVEGVHPELLRVLIGQGVVPIVAPIGIDGEGQVYNVNADTVAVAIAREMGAAEMLFVTDSGWLRDAAGAPIAECNRALFGRGLEEGWIQGGMRVKIQLALEALDAGVAEVRVCGADDLRGGTVVRA